MNNKNLIIYTDASICGKGDDLKKAHYGGYITNTEGMILFVFYETFKSTSTISTADITYFETLAIQKGLEYAKDMGGEFILAKTDSLSSVKSIQNLQFNTTTLAEKSFKSNTGLLTKDTKIKYKELIHKIISFTDNNFKNFELSHLPRAKNQYADYIVQYAEKKSKLKDKHKFFHFLNALSFNLIADISYDFIQEFKTHKHKNYHL